MLVFFVYIFEQKRLAAIPQAIQLVGDNFGQWIITVTYIKVSFETRMLLDKDTYFKSAADLVAVQKFKCWFTVSNVLGSLLILFFALTIYFGLHKDIAKLLYVSDLMQLSFQFLCLLAWGLTLIRLYRDIKNSEKLLPNKRLFTFHGLSLATYLLLYALADLLAYLGEKSDNADASLILFGVYDLITAF